MKTPDSTRTISRQNFLKQLAVAVPLLSALPALAAGETPEAPKEAQPDMGNLRTFVELARSDLRLQRAFLVAQNLPLTDDEAVDFWPLQRQYETELAGVLDKRYDAIVQFAHDYGSMTDAQATDLANKSFNLEEKRTALKRKYFAEFCKVIPATKAARFFQIDNQLNMILDLRIAGSLPLIK